MTGRSQHAAAMTREEDAARRSGPTHARGFERKLMEAREKRAALLREMEPPAAERPVADAPVADGSREDAFGDRIPEAPAVAPDPSPHPPPPRSLVSALRTARTRTQPVFEPEPSARRPWRIRLLACLLLALVLAAAGLVFWSLGDAPPSAVAPAPAIE